MLITRVVAHCSAGIAPSGHNSAPPASAALRLRLLLADAIIMTFTRRAWRGAERCCGGGMDAVLRPSRCTSACGGMFLPLYVMNPLPAVPVPCAAAAPALSLYGTVLFSPPRPARCRYREGIGKLMIQK